MSLQISGRRACSAACVHLTRRQQSLTYSPTVGHISDTRKFAALGVRIPGVEPHPVAAVVPPSRTDNEQWRLIAEAVRASYPEALTVPYVSLGGTDSRHFHPRTPEATYRFAALRMSAVQRRGVHGIDEHVTIDALAGGEPLLRTLICSLG